MGKSILFAVIGFIAGLFVASSGDSYLVGAFGGAIIGFLIARISRLELRILDLESSARKSRFKKAPAPEPEPTPESTAGSPRWATPEAHKSWVELESDEAISDSGSEPQPTGEAEAEPYSRPLGPASDRPETGQQPLLPSLFERGLEKAKHWITSGNVPVKVGVIVTFIGVSFLLKYAIDKELVVFPLEFRLLAVAVVGLALIVIGWRLREKMRVYALSLQGGGIGVMFLTIFAAFRIWQLLPPTLTFVLLVALTFLTGALAVLQNSRILALFGIVGGFLAPVLTSTGQGSHVVLFSYYLLLNGAILGISWFRAWRELNLAGFIFTFVIGSLWGHQYYKPELMASTMPFLVLHFLFYQAIAVLFALRQPPDRIGVVDGTLVFGTPAIVFALQAVLVQDTEYGLAISAAVAAVFYAVVGAWLYRRRGDYLRLLTESFIALAVAFATITIPLALDARWTAAAWALEGAALVWVGVRQGHQLPKFAGVLLILFSGGSFIDYGWRSNSGLAVINGNVLGGLLISLSALFASRLLEKTDKPGFEFLRKLARFVLFLWGVMWWFGTGLAEVTDRVSADNQLQVFLLFVASSVAFASWLGLSRDWLALRRIGVAFLPSMALLALIQFVFGNHFLRELGWLAWPVAWAVQAQILRVMDKHESRIASTWHFASLLLLTGMLAFEAAWRVDQVVSDAWAGAVATVVTGIMALLVWRCRERPSWPVPTHPVTYFNASLVLVVIQVLTMMVMSINAPGDPHPLAYFPVFNPFDLATLFAMLVGMLSLGAIRREEGEDGSVVNTDMIRVYRWMLAAAFFILTTAALVRGVHHYTGVAWESHTLASSMVVQTSLSIYWGLLGFTGMIWGARRLRRSVWLVGAGFMALVIVKLFLVDLGNTGTVERIISFLGIGALLLIVGYFAPAPPRRSRNEGDPDDEDGNNQ